MYHYWGFGLSIASEIEFPELLPYSFTGPPDVTIITGTTPRGLTGADMVHKVGVSIGPTQYLLKLLNIANYHAYNGDTIIIEPLAAADDKSIRLFLLSGVMAAILHQRDRVILHASAIEYQDGVVLFCGPANSGKSTTASKLMQKGYKLFSDDICVLQFAGNSHIEVLPSYPMLKLWEDSFAKLNIAIPPPADKVRPGLAKYGIFYHDEFDISAKPVKQVYILNKSLQPVDVKIKQLSPIDGFREVHDQVYHRLQIYPMKKQASNFTVISKLTAAIPVFMASWYDDEKPIDQLCRRVELNLQVNG